MTLLMILELSYFHVTSAAESNSFGDDKLVTNYVSTTSKGSYVDFIPEQRGDERNEHEIEKLTNLLSGVGMRKRPEISCSCYNCGTFQCYCRGCSSEMCCI
ncbi:hypothetical protein K7X08_026095 [Anisodus acutangulus]|uniref:Uncharacterized protein n=1 Tax=Anisodus acutangulus TaxID=402998 RepID=A0A9Q1N2G0_9SOLA|nr:hypothetical protein K7X08_026095 [Anisodus acutangulus]